MVIWIIGLSGSGKTTLGTQLYALWKKEAPNAVLIDGDEIRRMFAHDRSPDAYTVEERRRNAERICELCAWLDRQGINVVCCILSLFEESRDWNRRTYSKYFEVYIDVPMDVLARREVKGLYAAAKRGELHDVVGLDIPFTPPSRPDYIFDNRTDNPDFHRVAREILTAAQHKI